MIFLYRCLLHLYPAVYRREFGDEMAGVFDTARSGQEGLLRKSSFLAREFVGLLAGAVQERFYSVGADGSWLTYSPRRFCMHSGFRFPKSTALLMAVILAGLILAIEKAKSVAGSFAANDPALRAENISFFGAFAVIFLTACIAAVIGWAVLFALGRSGVHRLAEMSPTATLKNSKLDF